MAKIKRICDVEGCGKPHHSKGWCATHYMRWHSHGDPLGGGASPGEPPRYFNEVVLAYDGNECLHWPFARTKKGYGMLYVDGRLQTVSRVVCECVNGPPPTPEHEAAHSCGMGHKGCVTKRHLDWKTPAENCADKILHDTHNRGERHGIAKLTKEQAIEIQALRGTVSQSELAARFGVSQSTVSLIQNRKNWAWLSAKSEPA
mgnify:CR=1 FL=1